MTTEKILLPLRLCLSLPGLCHSDDHDKYYFACGPVGECLAKDVVVRRAPSPMVPYVPDGPFNYPVILRRQHARFIRSSVTPYYFLTWNLSRSNLLQYHGMSLEKERAKNLKRPCGLSRVLYHLLYGTIPTIDEIGREK